jgi:hypothetical protein
MAPVLISRSTRSGKDSAQAGELSISGPLPPWPASQ